ncbi:lamin tail domain-containing protein (plasmid) [Haladaptatus sp. SPP-AMP-3]|uniref:lamin tail domain-containing protein n=1 Tax=Haladaptatus sp. SPP-AMP-3 TaxID=3121295 RepID=UPI003C2D4178
MENSTKDGLAVVLLSTLLVCGVTVAIIVTPATAEISGSQQVTVTNVVDGDTLDVQYENGTTDTVRLLGVDTPETYGKNTPDEWEGVPNTQAGKDCLHSEGEDAKAFMKNNLEGKRITLKFDSESDHRGYYGRLLAYVYYGGEDYNYKLIESGQARVYDAAFSKSSSYYSAESSAQNTEQNAWTCRNVGSGGASVSISQIHEDAAGNDNDNLNDEYVVFENTGSTSIDLSGWTVTDESGKTYTFSSLTLSPGQTVTLHSGSGSDTSSDVFWGRSTAVWNNGGDTVSVSDGSGASVATKVY